MRTAVVSVMYGLASCLAVTVAFGGCMIEDPQGDDGYYQGSGAGSGLGSGWGGGGGTGMYDYGCHADTDCGGTLVCTRTGECLDASQVHAVHTMWTVRGKPATVSTCSNAPDLSITFTSGAGEEMGYTPVPCEAGKHTVDKFPRRFTTVYLTRAYDYSGGASGLFDADGNAHLDLPY